MASVTITQLANAYRAFRQHKKLAYNQNAVTLFFKFLGAKGHQITSKTDYSDETVRKVELLNGPHAQTMLKIYEAQHADE